MQKPIYAPEDEQLLMTRLWSPAVKDDPEAFVLFAFPWGQENTPLAKDRKSTRLNSSHSQQSRMPSSA